MSTSPASLLLAFVVMLASLAGCVTTPEVPLPRSWEEGSIRFEETLTPLEIDGKTLGLHMLSARKPGAGPLPAIILTHGSSGRSRRDLVFRYTNYDVNKYRYLLEHFAKRGYAAFFFSHKGHSRSEGEIARFTCVEGNYTSIAESVGDDFEAVHRHVAGLAWVDGERIFVGGQSTGGIGAIHFASRKPAGVVGVVNFAGTYACSTSAMLTSSIWSHGGPWPGIVDDSARIPQLWVYGTGDRYLDTDDLAPYTRLETISLLTLDGIGHGVMREETMKGTPNWVEEVEAFLAARTSG